jgi:hypothetical protein
MLRVETPAARARFLPCLVFLTSSGLPCSSSSSARRLSHSPVEQELALEDNHDIRGRVKSIPNEAVPSCSCDRAIHATAIHATDETASSAVKRAIFWMIDLHACAAGCSPCHFATTQTDGETRAPYPSTILDTGSRTAGCFSFRHDARVRQCPCMEWHQEPGGASARKCTCVS